MSLHDLRDEVMNGPRPTTTKRPLRLAIDFDSTIHDPFTRNKGYKMGTPVDGAAESIRQLRLQGHYIIIFPTWADTEKKRQAIIDWLTYFGVEYDDVTSTKPEADVYLDNNALRFTSWDKALRDITGLQ